MNEFTVEISYWQKLFPDRELGEWHYSIIAWLGARGADGQFAFNQSIFNSLPTRAAQDFLVEALAADQRRIAQYGPPGTAPQPVAPQAAPPRRNPQDDLVASASAALQEAAAYLLAEREAADLATERVNRAFDLLRVLARSAGPIGGTDDPRDPEPAVAPPTETPEQPDLEEKPTAEVTT